MRLRPRAGRPTGTATLTTAGSKRTAGTEQSVRALTRRPPVTGSSPAMAPLAVTARPTATATAGTAAMTGMLAVRAVTRAAATPEVSTVTPGPRTTSPEPRAAT